MMHVSGKVDGLRKGTLFLQKILDSTLVNVDSIVINGEPEFEFRTEINPWNCQDKYLSEFQKVRFVDIICRYVDIIQ